jgi:hypothetical protein
MIFLMNVLNREENMTIGYLGTPLLVAVVVGWSLSLSNEGEYSESSFSAGNLPEDAVRPSLSSLRGGPSATSRTDAHSNTAPPRSR